MKITVHLTCIVLLAASAAAETYTVAPGGDIQAAIDGASNGDVILLQDGEYLPATTIDTGGKAISILGATNKTTGQPLSVIDGQGAIAILRCANGENSDTILENLVLRGGNGDGGGLLCDASSPTVRNCLFTSNSTESFGGAMLNDNGASPLIIDCVFEGNSAAFGGGIFNRNASEPDIRNCRLENNSATSGGGMYNNTSNPNCESTVFRNNTVADFGGGVSNFNSDPNFQECSFENNSANSGGGIASSPASNPLLSDCDLCGNTPDPIFGNWTDDGGNCFSAVCDTDNDGILDCNDPCPTWPHGCSEDGQTILVPVDQSIQAAIDLCPDGGVVQIAAGTFMPDAPLNTGGRALTVRGSLPATTIDGGGVQRVITCTSGEQADTIFERLLITGGYDSTGGGMYCQGSSPTISNCTFLGNTAELTGGGLSCESGSSPTLVDCTFQENLARANSWQPQGGGGVFCRDNSNPLLDGCTFLANNSLGSGGGVESSLSNPSLEGCMFQDNTAERGGGGLNCTTSQPTLIDCVFMGNASDTWLGGGMSSTASAALITGCIFQDNSARDGGGLYEDLSTGTSISNSTFCSNAPTNISGDGGWQDGGGNCFLNTCNDGDNDGTPDCLGTGIDIELDVPGEYPTIAMAVDMAGTGAVINIAAGTYETTGTIELLGKSITLRGETGVDEQPLAIIDGQGLHGLFVVEAMSGNAAFENLVLANGHALKGGGMLVMGGNSPSLTNCTFRLNSAESGGGLYCNQSDGLDIQGCVFEENTAANDGGGICVDHSTNLSITGSTFTANLAGDDGGGLLFRSSTASLDGCVVQGNAATDTGGGLDCSETGSVNLANTIICGNTTNQVNGACTDLGGNCIQESCDDCESGNCPADLTDNGLVDGEDLGLIFAAWGPCGGSECPADLSGDGLVDGQDLGLLFAAWGPCN